MVASKSTDKLEIIMRDLPKKGEIKEIRIEWTEVEEEVLPVCASPPSNDTFVVQSSSPSSKLQHTRSPLRPNV